MSLSRHDRTSSTESSETKQRRGKKKQLSINLYVICTNRISIRLFKPYSISYHRNFTRLINYFALLLEYILDIVGNKFLRSLCVFVWKSINVSSKWIYGELPLGQASFVPVYGDRVSIDQLESKYFDGNECDVMQSDEVAVEIVRHLPNLIPSIVSSSTKLCRPIAMPQRMAPACPAGPPCDTLATMSTFPANFANSSGK